VRLTVYTDFSLRVLMFLALKGDGLATIAEVAKAYGISKNHLMKVAHQLGVAGYVETVRGKGGGLRLARRPQDIVIGEVVRRTEPDMALVPCFAPNNASCAIFSSCALRGVLSKARDAFLSALDGHTLADLVRPRAPLRKLLSFNPNGRTAAAQTSRSVRRA
jgi:Rrf2 family transcriptional regulator, nitric oxide-sensitive transcriptional repressor